ncbi:MAG TPA: hypothetical protein PK309_08915 [Bacillota bacterium]|nr:hypothetical protein [Bacillota bacterium]
METHSFRGGGETVAVYRQVHVSFWQDPFILNLTPEEKYFYLYLMTNSKTSQCGIYEISKKVMMFETGYNLETVEKLLNRFIEYGKVAYDEETGEIFLLNWPKYNWNKSDRVLKCIAKELEQVKSNRLLEVYNKTMDSLCIPYEYSMDRPGEEKEKEKEKEEDIVPYQAIVDLFHELCPSLPKLMRLTNNRRTAIKNRWKEYGDLEAFRTLFARAEASDFLSGRNGKWTNCNFDWLIKPSNAVKVLEGTYDNNKYAKNQQPAYHRPIEFVLPEVDA